MTEPQITMAHKIGESIQRDSIFSFHSGSETDKNYIVFKVWIPSDGANLGSLTALELNSNNTVKMIHILPIDNEVFSIGSTTARWEYTTGSELYTDTTLSKTFHVYSGQ